MPRRAAKSSAAVESRAPERLHVRIAHCGVTSRRKAETLIQEGRVTVNGEIVMEMGVRVNPEDEVAVDGIPLEVSRQFTVLLNKPKGVVTTMFDPEGRRTIISYLPEYGVPLKPVGRLDKDTEGLLLCTNDGDLAHRLSHPRYGVEKEYVAVVVGIPDAKALDRLRKGIYLEGRKTSPAQVEVIHAEEKSNSTGLRLILHEGRKRQIRLMCDAVGHPVSSLRRVRIAHLRVKGMRPGECRLLGKQEVDELRKLVGLAPLYA
jgi:pseudouridine synthase